MRIEWIIDLFLEIYEWVTEAFEDIVEYLGSVKFCCRVSGYDERFLFFLIF
jgi:hypothetical protein